MMSIAELPKYEAYKDSEMMWVSEFPQSWRIEKGKWLFNRAERSVRGDDEIVTCFRDGVVTLRKNRRTEGFTNALKEHGYQGIRKGDLVIHAMDAFAGAIGVSDSDGKSTPVYAACVPRNKGEVLPEFYAYFFRDMALSGFVASLAKGIRERSTDFRFNDFAELALPVPLFEDQCRIAKFLDKRNTQIDDAIAIKQQQIALLKERKQIITQKAVTQGLDPSVPMKNSGVDWIGKIPAHWAVESNRSLFSERVEPGREGLPLLSVSIHSGVSTEEVSEEDNIRGRVKIQDKTKYVLVKSGDVAFNMMRAWQGGIGAVTSDGMVSPAYIVARPKGNILAEFFEYQYRCPEFIQQMDRYSKGITDFRKRLYWDSFKQLQTVVPPKPEQVDIIRYIQEAIVATDSGVSLLVSQIEKLKEYKTTLINSAVTGKIKITPDMVEA